MYNGRVSLTDHVGASCRCLPLPNGTLKCIRPELAPGLRSVREGSNAILFRDAGDALEIIRILHATRDITALIQSQRPDA